MRSGLGVRGSFSEGQFKWQKAKVKWQMVLQFGFAICAA
jgi:hypothetical protein